MRTKYRFAILLALGLLPVTSIGLRAQELVAAVETSDVSASDAVPAAPDLINTLHQREWVRLNAEGAVEGTVSLLSREGELQAAPSLVTLRKDGQQVVAVQADASGKFLLPGVATGTYALVAQSENAFSTYAIHVFSEGEHLPSSLSIYAATIGKQRAYSLIAESWVPSAKPSVDYYRNHETDPLADKRKFNESHRVRLQGAELVGRVSRPGWVYADQDLTGSVARVIQNGKVVGTAAVAKDGYFRIKDMVPGTYDLFVGGDDGVAVVGFQAIEADKSVSISNSGVTLVAAQADCCDTICCELVQPVEVSMPVVETEVVAMDPGLPMFDPGLGGPVMGGGFAAPGGFGGGGVGGGLGGGAGLGGGPGLGGLLGIAGLAVGVAALGDEDDFNPPAATPIGP